MDTHPIQASPQRWIVALGLLLVAGVQGLFLWGYTDDGIWVSLLDGMAATLLFALSAYWAWYVLGFVHISITTLFITIGEFYQFNLSSCIRQQNSLTAQFVSFSLSNLANIFYPPRFLQ